MEKIRCIVLVLLTAALLVMLAGCGGDDDDNDLVQLDITNLAPIANPSFLYAAWVRADGNVTKLGSFNTESNGSLSFSRFSLVDTPDTGDEVFITIEPNPAPDPEIPSDTVVLTGTVQGNTALLTFPELQGFTNTTGTATVSGAGNNQLLTEFTNLPDVSDDNFVYQGWLRISPTQFFPLSRFDANQVPVSDTVPFDVTDTGYFLSVEPEDDPDPDIPYSIQPLFTNGNLQAVEDQPLVRSSLTPNTANFRFPSAVATISN